VRRVRKKPRRWQRRRRRAGRDARVDVPKLAVDKDELRAALEHALDDGAAGGALFAPARVCVQSQRKGG